MKNYIIYAPKYCKSNGVRVLYRLADLLSECCYNAYVYAVPDKSQKCNYIREITDEMRLNDIVIYPEIVKGNPLQFQNVVRWVLYFPGVLGGDKKYDDYEEVFTFDKDYLDGCPILAIPNLDHNLFYKDDTVKDTDCYFVYKRGKWRNIPEFNNMTEINAIYPKTREELAKLLRRTKTLYSYDDHTLLLDEAIKCGCKVKIITKSGYKDYISDYDERYKDHINQLNHFIQITQNMQYNGRIKPICLIFRIRSLIFKLISYVCKYILFNNDIALIALLKSKGML